MPYPTTGPATWFVTGASRGLGLELVTQLLRRGDNVAATTRSADRLTAALDGVDTGRLLALELNLVDEDQVRAAVAATKDRFGGLDVVVNNAGFGFLADGAGGGGAMVGSGSGTTAGAGGGGAVVGSGARSGSGAGATGGAVDGSGSRETAGAGGGAELESAVGVVLSRVDVTGVGAGVVVALVLVGAGLSASVSSPNIDPMPPHRQSNPMIVTTTMMVFRLVRLARARFSACRSWYVMKSLRIGDGEGRRPRCSRELPP